MVIMGSCAFFLKAGAQSFFKPAVDQEFGIHTGYADFPNIHPWQFRFLDADGDGDQDLFFTGMDSLLTLVFVDDSISVWFQENTGSPQEAQYAPPVLAGTIPAEYLQGSWRPAGLADFDNDGDLDLYVGNEQVPCQLFENDGQGRFRDVAQRAGVENRRFTKGVVWGDFDADGYPDLYVSNYGTPQGNSAADDGAGAFTSGGGEPNRLYRNNRDGTFTDVAEQLGVSRPLVSFPAWFWDFNNDGALDLFVATFDGTVHQVAQEFLGIASGAERPCLYEGDGRGGFREVAAERKLDRMSLTMGANFGDLNNDGFLDVYLGTGHPPFEALMPNLMLLSQGGQTFADVTTAGGFGHLQKGHAIAFADIDNDGDQDVFAEMGGAFPGDTAINALFRNVGFDNHWLTVKLIGQRSNKSAIGARLRLVIDEAGGQREIYRWVSSGGSFGANPLRQEIGLGAATIVTTLEIHWPTTGQSQSFHDLPADQWLEIREGDSEYRVLNVR